MADLFENKETGERVILVGVSEQDGDDTEDSLLELAELAKTAGAEVLDSVIQKRDRIHPGTYVGKGKVEEILEMIHREDATGVICDDELSPAQLRNLTDLLQVKVMDRTLVILDIFALRATSREGKIQVELAQLKYRATRLTGMGRSMSRLGGGIGTRGPGEKKLEIDRRLIGDRITQLKQELAEVRQHREINRAARLRNQIPVAAIVGYTNAGKSTLLNTLTKAGVLEENMLFATLDPTTRLLELAAKQEILLTDTVGFIRKLPHHLIEAFRSTLEEAKHADYILHMVDESNPQAEKQMHIVYQTLKDLKIEDKKIITLFNKQDLRQGKEPLRDFQADHTLRISAKQGDGLAELTELLSELLRDDKILVDRVIPYPMASVIQQIRKNGELLEEEYRPEGIYIKAYVSMETYGRIIDLPQE